MLHEWTFSLEHFAILEPHNLSFEELYEEQKLRPTDLEPFTLPDVWLEWANHAYRVSVVGFGQNWTNA